MRALNIFLRIAKFLGKVSLGVLLALVIVVAVMHLPPIQEKITRTVTNYLSAKIEARVAIQRIKFSIGGNVAIHNITVWDRAGNKILSAKQIEVNSNMIDLITGNFNFDDVTISGVEVELIQGEEGTNIQFILDAFRSEATETTNSSTVTLKFNRVQLENIAFKFTSIPTGTKVDATLGKCIVQEGEFHTNPNKIRIGDAFLQRAVVNILSTSQPDTTTTIIASTNDNLFGLDTDIGIGLDLSTINVEESDFSLHKNEVITTPKFDPDHLSLKNIQISLSDILVNKDTLNAHLLALSAQLPGFTLTDAGANLEWNREGLTLTKLHLASNTNQLEANLKAWQELDSIKEGDNTHIEVDAQCQLDPKVLAYFFSDTVMNHFNDWESAEVMLEGNYHHGKGAIKTLSLKTGNSQLLVDGKVVDVMNLDKISWRDMKVSASIGSDFKKSLTPYISNIGIPQDLTIQLTSSGNLKQLAGDGKILTNWGNVKFNGETNLQADHTQFDVTLTGEKVDLGKWTKVSSLGSTNLSLAAKGNTGKAVNIEISGLISDIEILNQSIHNIAIESSTKETNTFLTFSIDDPNYQSQVSADISLAEPMVVSSNIQLEKFRLGALLQTDSTLIISGGINTKITIGPSSSLAAVVGGKSIFLKNSLTKYLLDTVAFHGLISPALSDLEFYANHEKGKVVSNFDLRNSRDVIEHWTRNIFRTPADQLHPEGSRSVNFNIELENANLLQLFDLDVDDVSSLRLSGEFDEQIDKSSLQITSGKFNGYGISLDTLHAVHTVFRDSLSTHMNINNLYYDSVALGNANLDILTKGDTAISKLVLTRDSITLLSLKNRILPVESGALVYTDQLLFLNKDYHIDSRNPVSIRKNDVAFNHFLISQDDMALTLNGDLNAFTVSFKNLNLTTLNYLMPPDTLVINKGRLTGDVSYIKDQQLNLKANIDSLILYNSQPLTLAVTAVSNGDHVPFEVRLTNESNAINLSGQYFLDQEEVDAVLKLDVNNPELFSFLVSGVVEDMSGSLKGETTIIGPLKKPALKGYLQFHQVRLTTVNPKLTFYVPDDRITLDNSALLLNKFTLYDEGKNPLIVNGSIDYKSFAYDLKLTTDQYALINKPDSASGNLTGKLVIDSDITLKGNERDTNVEAKLTVKDATKLTFTTSQNDIELLKAEGIVEFVDPALLLDSAAREQSSNFYDSLIASLPDFKLNSTVKIEDNASIRIIIDEQSGDYIETSGGASLELGYDRTGNMHLTGDYTVRKGVYRLSFYDLVKKNFTLVSGSSITWNGTPQNGDLNIKAVHTVESNSIGLIGHEIGENEKSIYKRALDYEVGININGTIEKPIITFSLDLPQNEKASYPVLANKLERLRQPEYASELNKQVFGLLVLGGFLPESSSDINSNTIATTALSNSVNNLLASQLNRFASQYIKNVNIDVGIQSYSDYSTPGGKTQTAMDFRVSKTVMNDRLSFEIGGDFNINQDQSGANTGKNYRGDIAIIYDLTGNNDKQLKLFNNQTYDIIYQEIRNTGISLVFIREFARKERNKNKGK